MTGGAKLLRELVRHRKAVVGTMAAERNRTLKLLEEAARERDCEASRA